jgi:hypothetical protein
MALLFAYGISGFISADLTSLGSNSNLIALMWFVVALVELFGYGLYAWCFGFASERMVCPLRNQVILGSSSQIVQLSGNPASKRRVF